jgi:hypothetical protein
VNTKVDTCSRCEKAELIIGKKKRLLGCSGEALVMSCSGEALIVCFARGGFRFAKGCFVERLRELFFVLL